MNSGDSKKRACANAELWRLSGEVQRSSGGYHANHAASISIPVSVTAPLRRVEQGKFSFDMPINSYLETWQLSDKEFTDTKEVTLLRIISHSANLNGHGCWLCEGGTRTGRT